MGQARGPSLAVVSGGSETEYTKAPLLSAKNITITKGLEVYNERDKTF